MKEVVVKIPEDIVKEVEGIEKIDVSLLVNKLLMERILEVVRVKRILEKSKLTEEKAKEIADEISEALYKRYKKLYEEKFSNKKI